MTRDELYNEKENAINNINNKNTEKIDLLESILINLD